MRDSFKPFIDLTSEERQAAGSATDAVLCFRLISFAGQRLRYLLDQRLREDGLTSQQGFLLTVVRMRDRPTLGETAAVMSTTHQNAKQIALALERKGMLKIVADRDDARIRRLEATEAGKRGWRSRDAEDYAAIGKWFATLSRDEQRMLSRLLSRLANAIR